MAQVYTKGPNGFINDTPGVLGLLLTNGDELVITVLELERLAQIARLAHKGIHMHKPGCDCGI